jgi:dihydrofolate synthase/folylpolyglutamate synthase
MSSDDYLQRFLALHPKAIDLTLDRVLRLLAALDHPERKLPPVIHIAGTNGKGSLVAYLRAMLEAADYKVHAYTSPHLVHFHERIRIAGRLISEPELADILRECEAANRGAPITFFEATTAAAFVAFARHPADVVLLEVGLGGIGDATNVIDNPAVTAITPIGIDHTQFLGSTLAEIALNKAGIIKPARPVVVGRQRAEAAAVLKRVARERSAPLMRFGHEWDWVPTGQGFCWQGGQRSIDLPAPALLGLHQFDNAATAVAVLDRLEGFTVGTDAIASGLRNVQWPARLQRLIQGPLLELLHRGDELWLDGGHNEDCGLALAAQAAEWHHAEPDKKLALVFGMLTSKDAQGFLKPLAAHSKRARAVAIPGHASYSATEAAERAQAVGLPCSPADNIAAAIADLRRSTDRKLRILICGSLYLAGTVLAQNG